MITASSTPAQTITSQLSQISYSLEVKSQPWVKLSSRPSPYCSDKARLLYRISFNEWVAWIPDYGEVRLKNNQFHTLS